MVFTSIATTGPLDSSASKRQIKVSWRICYHAPGAADQSACRSLPGTPGLTGAGRRKCPAGARPRSRHRCHNHKEGWALPHILGSSVSYRIAVGPQQGRKAFMIRTIRPLDRPDTGLERVAKANGFSLHAGVAVRGTRRRR